MLEILKSGNIEFVLDFLNITYSKTNKCHYTIINWNSKKSLETFCSYVSKLDNFDKRYGSKVKTISNPKIKFKTQGYIWSSITSNSIIIEVRIKLNKFNNNLEE